jgi:hypothetical protein
MRTLLLDRDNWDLCLDAAGNIAMASEPYSQVQDVASAARLFTRELWYGGDRGVPYFSDALGRFQPTQLLRARIVQAALSVPGVETAVVYFTKLDQRTVGGQIQITTGAGPAVIEF